MEWGPVYAELSNKFRWSISTTAASMGCNYGFAECTAMGNQLAGDVITLMKLKEEKPDLRFTEKSVKDLLNVE